MQPWEPSLNLWYELVLASLHVLMVLFVETWGIGTNDNPAKKTLRGLTTTLPQVLRFPRSPDVYAVCFPFRSRSGVNLKNKTETRRHISNIPRKSRDRKFRRCAISLLGSSIQRFNHCCTEAMTSALFLQKLGLRESSSLGRLLSISPLDCRVDGCGSRSLVVLKFSLFLSSNAD